ncbi:uncharacterized protein N7483_004836 [Penicillium malachiteum]|uniref:uncharacterized protein n=1 Tax=Penicillium malachiteum TaxID=1324776 RepID=UPI00254845D0|nr:uncharacterized protein N7483_004836 [Penicillium malachiteum]KAJ5730328.1 hypothetical protein N7483_004836 [Penicillium malachiteum]
MGNLFSVLISYGTEHAWPSVTDERSFRVSLNTCIALPVLICIGFLVFIAKSPSWPVLHGHHEKARKSLRWLYPRDTEQALDLKLAEIAYTVLKEAENWIGDDIGSSNSRTSQDKTAGYIDCFRGVDLRRSFCAIFPALSQPFYGNVICGPYATYFFSMVGFSNSLSATAIVLCGYLPRVGRWAILFGGLTLMFIGELGIGLVGSIEPNVKSSSAASGLIIFFVCILGCGSFSGPGAVGWTYTGESGSMHLRAKTNTLGNLGNAGIAWVFVSTVSYMIAGMSLSIGYFYAGMTALSMIIVYFFIPDYNGRSYAQIDELFERRIPARKFSKIVCTGDYGHVA